MNHSPLRFSVASVASVVGRNISADEWARERRIVDRKNPSRTLDGADVTRITGVERKSWDPAMFRDFTPVVDVARNALEKASTTAESIEAVVLVMSTPFYAQLGMDGFEILKRLGVPDHVAPIQLHAGCAAMARAMQVLAKMDVERALIIAYEVSSPYMASPIYYDNTEHPMKEHLWMSAALFGDGAGAMVLRRQARTTGYSFYSRDSQSFGEGPAFDDPLIHYPGGGALHAPGTQGAEQLAAYGMNGAATKRYYAQGMMLNHRAFAALTPGYLRSIKRLYMHQASPRLVDEVRKVFMAELGVTDEMMPTNARQLGNIVAPATLKLLDDDVQSGAVGPGDEVCFSVVGAGPERGGFMLSLS